jgi:hypothetical protein
MPSRARLIKMVVGVGIIGLAYYVVTRIALSIILRHSCPLPPSL